MPIVHSNPPNLLASPYLLLIIHPSIANSSSRLRILLSGLARTASLLHMPNTVVIPKSIELLKRRSTLANEGALNVRGCGAYLLVILELIPTLDSCPTPAFEDRNRAVLLVDVWAGLDSMAKASLFVCEHCITAWFPICGAGKSDGAWRGATLALGFGVGAESGCQSRRWRLKRGEQNTYRRRPEDSREPQWGHLWNWGSSISFGDC